MKNKTFNAAFEVLNKAEKLGIIKLIAEDQSFDGKIITLAGKKRINFGSCSYMGLEIHERLKKGAIDAILRYGIQFSSSRSYVSCPLYSDLQFLLEQIFLCEVVLTPTITLGHQAAIPVLINNGDAIIMDQYAHASLQHIATKMQLEKVPLITIRHNSIDELESRIKSLKEKYRRIWFMGDSVYSMHGDTAPLSEIVELLKKYDNFYAYIDDAHGMSWIGKKGRGYTLEKVGLQEKMVIAISFAKAFGTGGGAILLPNKDWAKAINLIGGPLIFSGPNQIPTLGASIASANVHLTDEIYELQADLKKKINLCNKLLMNYQLPIVSSSETPIFFLALGTKEAGYRFVKRMIDSGFYLNLAIYPAVPPMSTGARFTITTHHSSNDLTRFVESLSFNFRKVIEETGISFDDIQKGFKKIKKFIVPDFSAYPISEESIKLNEFNTTAQLDHNQWNKLVGNGGIAEIKCLEIFEKVFKNNLKSENNWNFKYFTVEDKDGNIILATFFIKAFIKEDLVEPKLISRKIEERRTENQHFLCADSLVMGIPSCKGNYLYLNKDNENWKIALALLLERLLAIYNEENLGSIIFRDHFDNDGDLKKFMINMGFQKIPIDISNELNELAIVSANKYLNVLEKKYTELFDKKSVKIDFDAISDHKIKRDNIEKLYRLYQKTNKDNLVMNSFDWPMDFFENIIGNESFDVLELTVTNPLNSQEKLYLGFVINFITSKNYRYVLAVGCNTDIDFLDKREIYYQLILNNSRFAVQQEAKGIIMGQYANLTADDVHSQVNNSLLVSYVCYNEGVNKEIIEAVNDEIKQLKTVK